MKSSKRYVSMLAVLFAISVSLAFISGCSQNAVAPVQDNPDQPQLGGLFDGLTTDGLTTNGDVEGFSIGDTERLLGAALIGPKGGSIKIELPGFLPTTFKFPRGAVKVATWIVIYAHVEAKPSGALVVYDCGPSGTVFAVPVEVTQNEPPGKTTASLFYFNPKTSLWELQETAPVKNGFVTVHVNHFSKYGISR